MSEVCSRDCQCEHESHFDTNRTGVHIYGKPFIILFVVKTDYGTYHICAECMNSHMISLSTKVSKANDLESEMTQLDGKVQTREENGTLNYFDTIKNAMKFAKSNKFVWKISFNSEGQERVRLIRENGRFVYEPIELDKLTP